MKLNKVFSKVPVECEWDWTEWSDCTKTCENGTKTRSPIISQEALHGAPSCPSNETEFCNTDVFCPGSTKVNQLTITISHHQWTAWSATGAHGVSAPNLAEEDFKDEEGMWLWSKITAGLGVLFSKKHGTASFKTVQKVGY